MTPEEAYDEALRRIREAEETGALELDLSGLELHRLPPELECLTSLHSLKLFWSRQLIGDLSQLASLPRSNRSICQDAVSSKAICPS